MPQPQDQQAQDPLPCFDLHVQRDEQARAQDGDCPTRPDRPAEAPETTHEIADDEGGGDYAYGDGHQAYAGHDGRKGFDCFEVKRDVVEVTVELGFGRKEQKVSRKTVGFGKDLRYDGVIGPDLR